MADITLEHVYKSYSNEVYAVNDLDLKIADGEFMVFVGPSGCGKTTALRCIAGLEAISAGALRIGDRVVTNVEPRNRNIAMVFQSYALYPHMTVFQNMAFGLTLQKTPKAETRRRVEEAAEILGLTPYLERKPKELSGGQRQRVALGRATVREPVVFLMDEPLSNLDAKLRVQMRAEIHRLHRRLGTTTIYVTHDQVEAMTMGDRIAVMRDGVLQQVGTPAEVYTNPTNVFVAGFIGSPAMNLLPVSSESEAINLGTTRLTAGQRLTAVASTRPAGSELVLGVRPEHLEVSTPDRDTIQLPVTVDVVEYLGREDLIHGQTEVGEVVALLPYSLRPSPGDSLILTAPDEHVHLFDAVTGERLPTQVPVLGTPPG